MAAKFTNNATATLATSLTTSATSITVTTGQGALFPTLSAGDYFYATLTNSSNNIEIIKVTARSSDTLTATRAQEGTTARTWNSADKIELRVTAADLTNFAQLDSPNTFAGATTLSNALTYGGVTLANAVTGTGNMVLATSPTLTAPTVNGALTYGGIALANAVTGTGNMVLATSPTLSAPTMTAPVIDNPKLGYTTTATAAGTTTLTATSTYQQYFTGTTTQTVVLPVTSTLALGVNYFIKNNSTGVVTVQSSGGNTIKAIQPGKYVTFTCILLTGTTAASWDYQEVPSSSQIQPISASIATNAITITASTLTLDFRSTTLTSGTVTTVSGTPANLTIASTDSFGLTTAYGNQRLVILAINNAGTIELAASALYGGVSLDETGVITTATTATTATAIKAANVRTGVAYRVIGFVDATFTTATGWGSLAVVQGQGGEALTAMSSLGYGQTWQTVTRTNGTTYYNTTGKPIIASCWSGLLNGGVMQAVITVNGVVTTNPQLGTGGAGTTGAAWASTVVPVGASYVYSGSNISNYAELR